MLESYSNIDEANSLCPATLQFQKVVHYIEIFERLRLDKAIRPIREPVITIFSTTNDRDAINHLCSGSYIRAAYLAACS